MNDLVGFRFRPTDEEIIRYFLERKMRGIDFPVHAVNEVDIRKFDPWELTELSALKDEQVWYFFSVPCYKYPNSKRTDRTTSEGTGYWKITGKDREIKYKITRDVIGYKKTLVFYKGPSPNSVRTNWVMHEFHSCSASSYQKEFVFCRIKKKIDDKSNPLQDGQSSYWPSNSGNHAALYIGPQDWLLNPANHSAQSIGSQVNLELPVELGDNFSLVQPFMHPQQGPSPSNGSNNGSNVWSYQLHMNESEDDFVNSLLVDRVDLCDETIHARPHGFNPTKPLRRVYVGDSSDSDSDTETSMLQSDLETTKSSNGNDCLKEYQQMQRVGAPTETPSPSNRGQSRKGENGLFHDEISIKTISRERASDTAEHAIDQPQKENSVVKLFKDQKIAQTTHPKTNLQARSTRSYRRNRKDSFISLETSPLNHKQNPPSVYIRNVVVGVFLSVICFWEMTSLR